MAQNYNFFALFYNNNESNNDNNEIIDKNRI